MLEEAGMKVLWLTKLTKEITDAAVLQEMKEKEQAAADAK